MDRTEAHALSYLEGLGLGAFQFEPEPNRPPDFLSEGGIAVEARRLNQHAEVDGKPLALEHDSIPIERGMAKLIREMGLPSVNGEGWFVSYLFQRPAPLWKKISKLVKEQLKVLHAHGVVASKLKIADRFWLRLHPYSISRPMRFTFGGYSDRDSGGWLVHEVMRNAQICSDEKSVKVAGVRSKYAVWWLLLVDHIGLGASELETELFSANLGIHHDWDRLILLSPSDSSRAIDIPKLPVGP